MAKIPAIDDETAETVALQALAYVVSDGDRAARFLALTGLGPADIRASAGERPFLCGVLDHVCGDQTLLLAFAEHAELPPATVETAQRRLSGGYP